MIALLNPDQVSTVINMRKSLKAKVRSIVNRIGPELFKNFNKLKLIAKLGGQSAKSKTSFSEIEVDYEDEMAITRAFSSLQELENC